MGIAISKLARPSLKWQEFARSVLEKAGLEEGSELYSRLFSALSSVPRSEFVDEALSLRACEDVALPIGYGQTISKPSTVIKMLLLAGDLKGRKILEVGCGSGYCSALMSALGGEVYAIEYDSRLAQRARKRLDRLGFYKVVVHSGNGLRGLREYSPFEAVIISAAFKAIPEALFRQLSPQGGKLIAPILKGSAQMLTVFERKGGSIVAKEEGACEFVRGKGLES